MNQAYLRISNKVNLRRNSPSIFTDKSPNTKKPPSVRRASQYRFSPFANAPALQVDTNRHCQCPSSGAAMKPEFPPTRLTVALTQNDPLSHRTDYST